MTAPDQEPQTPRLLSPRKMADELSSELGGFSSPTQGGYDLLEVAADLSPTQRALISDTFGLLNGISQGVIDVGQPRIRDNLLRVIAELAQSPRGEKDQKLIDTLDDMIARASSCGLTAENQSLTGHRVQLTK